MLVRPTSALVRLGNQLYTLRSFVWQSRVLRSGHTLRPRARYENWRLTEIILYDSTVEPVFNMVTELWRLIGIETARPPNTRAATPHRHQSLHTASPDRRFPQLGAPRSSHVLRLHQMRSRAGGPPYRTV